MNHPGNPSHGTSRAAASKSPTIRLEAVPTVLLVDNDAEVLESFGVVLQAMLGAKVLQAASADHAWSLLARNSVGLVVIDASLPDLDGRRLVTGVREAHPMLPCIVMADNDDVPTGPAGGLEVWLRKPVTLEALLAHLDTVFPTDAARNGADPDNLLAAG